MLAYTGNRMSRITHIPILLLALSVVLAGLPVQAKPQCPMAAQMQMQQVDMKDCKGCANTTDKQEPQKKNGCCGDMACADKCSSMSNSGTIFFSTQRIASRSPASNAERFYGSDHVLASHLQNTQDRPPKYRS